MIIIFNNKKYSLSAVNDTVSKELSKMLPVKLKVSRSANHEYYGILQNGLSVDDAEKVSFAKADHLYYFREWNALALNFRDVDINPYYIYDIGIFPTELSALLKNEQAQIEIEIKEN